MPDHRKLANQDLRGEEVEPNRWRYPSPFKEWPGHIDVPGFLSAKQFSEWWTAVSDKEYQERQKVLSPPLSAWEMRHSWIIDCRLNGIDTKMITPDGLEIPDYRIIVWYGLVSEEVLEASTDLPNWPGPLTE